MSGQMSRLDMQITMYTIDPRPTEIHRYLHKEGADTVYNMPSTFIDLADAKNYLDLIQKRIWHFSKEYLSSRAELLVPINQDECFNSLTLMLRKHVANSF